MAVYTEIADEEVQSFAEEYEIGRVVACKGIAEGIENSNFLLVTEHGPFILTLYERRVKRYDLPFFLGLMEHLAARGIPCPTPIKGRDGRALRLLAGRCAAVVTFLRGMWPRRPTVAHCHELGQALARMHNAGGDFPMRRANDLSVGAWRPLHESTARHADALAPDLAAELTGELDILERRWPHDLPKGVIHADLFPDNVFFERDRLSGLIDFYFACSDFLAYDLAICLNAWCFEPDGSFNITKARHFVAQYHAIRPLSPEELDALPILARGAAMRFLLTRLYDWLNTPQDALVTPKNPLEYLQKLRFHRGARGREAYGLDDVRAD
jgi:homoserine kinase type II